MRKFEDFTGQRIERLSVVKFVGKNKHGDFIWLCRCDCGGTKEVTSSGLRQKRNKSCGCLKKEQGANFYRHGLCKRGKPTKLLKVWTHMKERCLNKENKSYGHYGGRGITVHEEWKNNFKAFYDYCISIAPNLEKLLAKRYQLDRINNDGNYEPGNIRFVPQIINARNKRNIIMVQYSGQQMPLTQAIEDSKTLLSYETIRKRIRDNWNTEESLFTVLKRGPKSCK